jgi:preflagellin peptidase FlaK
VEEMNEWLETSRVLLSLFFLVLSSWYDFKTREVSNKIWAIYGPAGLALLLLQFFADYTTNGEAVPIQWLTSIGLSTIVAFVLFYIGFFGGADSKALICLSLALPVYPSFTYNYIKILVPFFPLAVLVNSVLGASLLVVVITGYNLSCMMLKGERLFEDLKEESFWSKVIAFATGFRVDSEKLKGGSHYMPLERFSRGEDGKIIRHLKVTPRLEDDSQKEAQLNEFLTELHGKIWVTPGLPFLVFVTAGFIAALIVGDFTSWLILQMVAF